MEDAKEDPANDNRSNSEPRLYSARSAAVASVFGSVLAGSLLIALNYLRIRRRIAAAAAVVAGVAVLVALLTVSILIDPAGEYDLPIMFVLVPLQALIGYRAASSLQGSILDAHAASGGRFYSSFRALAVGTGVMVALLFVALLAEYVAAA